MLQTYASVIPTLAASRMCLRVGGCWRQGWGTLIVAVSANPRVGHPPCLLALSSLPASIFGQAEKSKAASAQIAAPKYSETISYDWSAYRVIVEFHRLSPNASWTVIIRDSWPALDQSEERGKTWGGLRVAAPGNNASR
jgi:hypothetical protein